MSILSYSSLYIYFFIILFTIVRFFYDFYVPDEQISQGDLKRIKKEMDRIIKSDYQIVKREVSRTEAR